MSDSPLLPPESVQTPVVEAKDVQKFFGNLHVLRGITMQVSPGEVVVVIGPSGSGKSAFLRCINGIERVDGGELMVCGNPVHKAGANTRRARLQTGIVFQQFNLFPHLTAMQNVTLAPMKVMGIPKHEKAESYPCQRGGSNNGWPSRARWP